MLCMSTIVLIGASRGWVDPQPVEARLGEVYDRVGRDMFVVHADRSGADRFAAEWCERWHVAHKEFAADFDLHGWRAGNRRNMDMLDFCVDQRKLMGDTIEMAVFRLPDDRMSADLDRLVLVARGYKITGRMIRARAAA